MAILGVAQTAIGIGAGLFGGDDGKAKEREQKADALYSRAMSGDRTAEVQLRCLAGQQSARDEAIRLGLLSPAEVARGQECGFATAKARGYALALVGKLSSSKVVADTAGKVAAGATKVGLDANPKQFLDTTVATVKSATGFGGVPDWVIYAGGAALLVWLIRK